MLKVHRKTDDLTLEKYGQKVKKRNSQPVFPCSLRCWQGKSSGDSKSHHDVQVDDELQVDTKMSPLSHLVVPVPCVILPLSAGETVIGSNQGKVLPACDADAQAGKPCGEGPGNSPQLTGGRNLDTSVRPPGRSGVLGCLPPRHLTPREQHMRPEAEDPPSGAHTPGLSEQRHESGLF